MAVVSIVLTFFSGFLVFVGLIPCFGALNWVAIPLCGLTVVSGLVGLFVDRHPVTQRMRGVLAHAFAIGTGSLLVLVAIVRCAIGLGVL